VRTLVVVPTYLEAENIEEYLQRTRAAMPSADILVVDDSSPDGTADLAQKVGEEVGQVDVLRRPSKEGLGVAYRAGFGLGLERDYAVIAQMDADLSHDPAVLPKLVASLEDGADMAVGSRYVEGGTIPHWPWHRRLLSRYGNLYASLLLRTGVRDATSGYRAYRAELLRAVDPATTRATGYGFQIELAYRAAKRGARIVELPITFTDRKRGMSKMTLKIAAEELSLVTRWGIEDRLPGRNSRSAPSPPSS
jgi:dolichol-phosphate mannosyltransferase